jgi:hypothetical protein
MTQPDPPKAPAPSPAGPAAPAAPAPPAPARRTGPRAPVGAIALLVVLIGAAAAAVLLLLRPRVEFTNGLAGSVRLVVGGDPPRTLAPGSSVRVGVARSTTTVAQWELVRPLSADGRPMGEEVRGSAVLREPSGTARLRAGSRVEDTAFFAPLITNATTRALRVAVNAGLQGAVDCGCAVRPGARRVFIGYYRLFRNSTVQARAAGAGSAEFRDLGPQVTSADGTVGLRFEDKDLRP